jgi:hypothetical protein
MPTDPKSIKAQGTLAVYLIIDMIEDESRAKILRDPNGVSAMDRADATLLLDTAVFTHSFTDPSVSQELALADMNLRIHGPRGNVANNPVTQRPWSTVTHRLHYTLTNAVSTVSSYAWVKLLIPLCHTKLVRSRPSAGPPVRQRSIQSTKSSPSTS